MIERAGARPDYTTPQTIGDRAMLDRQQSFGSLLTEERFKREPVNQDQARDAARKLVAHALVLPVLKQFRETNKAAAPFAPNQAEKAFGSVMDQELASRLVSSKWGLVDAVARRLLKGLPDQPLPEPGPAPRLE